MILKIFSIRDSAVDSFGTPMFNTHTGGMVRAFTDEVNRAAEDNPYYKHPDDYELYEIGTFETDNAQLVLGEIQMVCRAKDVSTKFMEQN